MPSFPLNQFVDVDDTLCKQLLGLDIREQRRTMVLPTPAAEYKQPGAPCLFSSSETEEKSLTSHNWTQHKETSLLSRWNKMGFWNERAVSMVEGGTGGLGWASVEPSLDTAAALSNTLSLPTSTSPLANSSSRYKTELCRTFTERGVCKYGSKCQFAHGPEELRGINRHPKYKTEPCRTFHSIGFCPYGIRCHFVHNNEDDHAHAPHRPQTQASVPATRRPPLLKQSFSFPGFPTVFQPLEPSLTQLSFFCVPSTSSGSPSTSTTISDLLSLPFPEMNPGSNIDQAWESVPHFLPSPDSGCSLEEVTPNLSPSQIVPSQQEECLTSGESLGSRSLSLTSLSDHEGGCSSSASSQSGSDSSSAFEGMCKRLPIFSQLSVPDDGFCSEGSTSSGSFFL
ncbi:mRNA decay activator protein ZFP36L1 [Hoplias malabaricus]|uniref:mRNA decay activator protein ZFP36L1 n=1 Tax=Hoplias malabaricus TaxID=27720 RepID=UPI0034620EB7